MAFTDPGGGLGVPPGVPVLGSPTDGSTGVSVTPLFEWTESTSGCTFSLYIYQNGSVVQQIDNISTQTHQLTIALAYNTTYTWKITAINTDGVTDSAIHSFTTEQLPVPGQVPYIDITYGGNNAIPTFNWGSVANAEHYHIKITKP